MILGHPRSICSPFSQKQELKHDAKITHNQTGSCSKYWITRYEEVLYLRRNTYYADLEM